MRFFIFNLLCMVLFSNCAPDKHRENPSVSTTENLHTKYSPLLKKAALVVDSHAFDKIRLRCDHQVLPWVENALDAIFNKAAYTAKGADGGTSNYKDVPKTAEALMTFALDDKNNCSIPDYIARLEDSLDPNHKDFTQNSAEEEKDLRTMLAEMKEMQTVLRAKF